MARICFVLLTVLLHPFLAASDQASSKARSCRIDKLTASYPSNKTVSEWGKLQKWDEGEDQMRCAGVAALHITLNPQGLSLPNLDPVPRISYILQGQGIVGISYPWCPMTFQSEQSGDRYYKTLRVKKGDVFAVPSGIAHWCFNDGNEPLVAVTIADLNNAMNQLDPSFKTIYLAGDMPSWEKQQEESSQTNLISAFNTELMAEAMGISAELMRKIQRKDERGVLVKVTQGNISAVAYEEEEGSQVRLSKRENKDSFNRMDEGSCNVRLMQNVDSGREKDVFSKKAGWLNSINKRKLPFLESMDLSAEKGSLHPNAILVPHWSINAHTIIFVTQGEGHLQVVDNQGRGVFNDNVKEGQLTVVPQYYSSMIRAGSKGIGWISYMTSSLPMRSSLAGYMSTFMALPLQVMASSYNISISQAFKLKFNREHEMLLFPPLAITH